MVNRPVAQPLLARNDTNEIYQVVPVARFELASINIRSLQDRRRSGMPDGEGHAARGWQGWLPCFVWGSSTERCFVSVQVDYRKITLSTLMTEAAGTFVQGSVASHRTTQQETP